MNGAHLAQNSAKTLFFLRFGGNVKKNAIDIVAKRATIVLYEEYQVRRKKWCQGIESAGVNGLGARGLRCDSGW